jgi:hypothetical protein
MLIPPGWNPPPSPPPPPPLPPATEPPPSKDVEAVGGAVVAAGSAEGGASFGAPAGGGRRLPLFAFKAVFLSCDRALGPANNRGTQASGARQHIGPVRSRRDERVEVRTRAVARENGAASTHTRGRRQEKGGAGCWFPRQCARCTCARAEAQHPAQPAHDDKLDHGSVCQR